MCCVWPRARRKRRERVELTFLDACWSMHGDMWDISEVACIKSTPFSWACLGPRFGKEEKIFGLYCP